MAEAFPDRRPSDAFIIGWNAANAMRSVLEAAIAADDLTRAGVVEAANSIDQVTFGGSAPDQSYAGVPNDFVNRQSAIYKPSLEAYAAAGGINQTLSQTGATTGSVLVQDFRCRCCGVRVSVLRTVLRGRVSQLGRRLDEHGAGEETDNTAVASGHLDLIGRKRPSPGLLPCGRGQHISDVGCCGYRQMGVDRHRVLGIGVGGKEKAQSASECTTPPWVPPRKLTWSARTVIATATASSDTECKRNPCAVA